MKMCGNFSGEISNPTQILADVSERRFLGVPAPVSLCLREKVVRPSGDFDHTANGVWVQLTGSEAIILAHLLLSVVVRKKP